MLIGYPLSQSLSLILVALAAIHKDSHFAQWGLGAKLATKCIPNPYTQTLLNVFTWNGILTSSFEWPTTCIPYCYWLHFTLHVKLHVTCMCPVQCNDTKIDTV